MPLQFHSQVTPDDKSSTRLCKDINFDDAAFEIFFKNNFSSLCSHCQIEFGFDIDLAKEVVHAGFIKLWENRQKLLGSIPVKVYLYEIISNRCIDILRHRQVKQKYENYVLKNSSVNTLENGFNTIEMKNLAADIDKAVAELPEQMRQVFMLSRYEGLKYSEIASALSISVKTVETHMSRALVKLRKTLSSYLPLLATLFLFI